MLGIARCVVVIDIPVHKKNNRKCLRANIDTD